MADDIRSAENKSESMSEAHRFDMARARAIDKLRATGKAFTERDVLRETEREFEQSEAGLR